MGKKYQEVELKYKLKNAKTVVNALNQIGASVAGDTDYQKDTYYEPSHRSFFGEDIVSEWLRVRETNSKVQLNYKRWLPLGAKIQTHCEEYETDIEDVNALKMILKYMDFTEVVVVEKERITWKYGKYLVSIDDVKELGGFIEIEYEDEVRTEEIEPILEEMQMFLVNTLHAEMSDRDRRGYPYQMLEAKGVI